MVALQIPELTDGRDGPGSARLYYAYADALTDAGREDEARYWFAKAASTDVAGETDAAERADDLDMLAFDDLEAADAGDEEADAGDEGVDDGDQRGDVGDHPEADADAGEDADNSRGDR